MKAASLVLKTAEGIEAIGAESVDALLDLAKAARQSGSIKIKGVEVKVTDGVVIASWKPFPAYQFRVRDIISAPPVMAAKSRKSK